MLDVLTHDILPVFWILALGFLLGRFGAVARAEAAALNRIAFLVMQPALILTLVSSIDVAAIRVDGIGLYALCQLGLFGATFAICRTVLGRETIEAWLLAMCTVFVNTLLYVGPIATLIYGEAAALPITSIVAWDATVTFAFFIVTTDLMANRQASIGQSLRRVLSNPVLIAILIGLLVNAAGMALPEPVSTGLGFAGAAAAPLTLLALGVILSGHALRPSRTIAVVSGLKLLVFPALVWAALHVGTRPDNWNTLLVLGAAGPSGAMAFALAMLHGVRTDQIAPVVIWTSVLSLVSLAWLA